MFSLETYAELARKKGQHQNAAHIESITHAKTYCEPGYHAPEAGIYFGNWNCESSRNDVNAGRDVLRRLSRELERSGAELEWSDEWSTCSECSGAIRTSPNGYGWQRAYAVIDDQEVCQACIQKSPEAYLLSVEGNERRAVTFDFNLAAHGYTKLKGDFEHGLHRGQDASPELIAAELRKAGVTRFVFVLDSTGQFDFSFSVWVANEQLEAAQASDLSPAKTDGPSVSAAAERGLREASMQAAQLDGSSGVIVSKINVSDGTAETKVVSRQDFVDGKGLE